MTGNNADVRGPGVDRSDEVLTDGALELVALLHRAHADRRSDLLALRLARRGALAVGDLPDVSLPDPSSVAGEWRVPPPPPGLVDRRVEITGPTERKMMINAMNSGASVFMADFEDSVTPNWTNVVTGQVNVRDTVAGTITVATDGGAPYRLNDQTATLVVRPRGWHLDEPHVTVDGRPVAASLFDAGVFLFHNAHRLLATGTGPYLYLPKLEGAVEASLWAEVLDQVEEVLVLPAGSIRATVLIETLPAAFEMDAILEALGTHASGLNAGRWDYIFSAIKTLGALPDHVFPDRAAITMEVPFMRAYTDLLVRTCHLRGAHAIGGMAAFIPNRRQPDVTERAIAQVRHDKEREAGDGFDGTWVAHPDLVPVARDVFDRVLDGRPNQLDHPGRPTVTSPRDLVDTAIAGAVVTEAGLRNNVSVTLRYLAAWIGGTGAVAIFNLMEDAATAEISRSQIWQWIRHGAAAEGTTITAPLVGLIADEELERIATEEGPVSDRTLLATARSLFDEIALGDAMVEFLTIPGMQLLEAAGRATAVTGADRPTPESFIVPKQPGPHPATPIA